VKDFLENNRSLWDGWTRLHEKSTFYDLDGIKAGKSSLKPVELEELGEVSGKSLLHLQCHFGIDTLSWARLGARVTGVDFSGEAVALARSLSAELGIPAEFICSNLYDLPRVLEGEFDIVFTSYGVLSWLPDLDGWAGIIAQYLKPGGAFYIVEFHPLVFMLGDDGQTLEYPYFHSPLPIKLRAQGSYAAPDADFTHTEYNWAHSLSDVINAVLRAGLRLQFVHEFPYSSCEWPPYLTEQEAGRMQVKGRQHDLPLMFSMRGIR